MSVSLNDMKSEQELNHYSFRLNDMKSHQEWNHYGYGLGQIQAQYVLEGLERTPLVEAALTGNIENVKKLLNEIPKPSANLPNSLTNAEERKNQLNRSITKGGDNILMVLLHSEGMDYFPMIKFLIEQEGMDPTHRQQYQLSVLDVVTKRLESACKLDSNLPLTGYILAQYELLVFLLKKSNPEKCVSEYRSSFQASLQGQGKKPWTPFWENLAEPVIQQLTSLSDFRTDWLDVILAQNFQRLSPETMAKLIKAGAKTQGPHWIGNLGVGIFGSGGFLIRILRGSFFEKVNDAINYLAKQCPALLTEEESGKIFIEKFAKKCHTEQHRVTLQLSDNLESLIPVVLELYENLFSTGGSFTQSVINSYQKGILLLEKDRRARLDYQISERNKKLSYLAKVAQNSPDTGPNFFMNCCEPDDEDYYRKNLITSLQNNTTVHKLFVGPEHWDWLNDVFPKNKSITTVVLDDQLGDHYPRVPEIKQVAEILKKTSNIKKMIVHDKYFDTFDCLELLLSNPNLESFQFSNDDGEHEDEVEHFVSGLESTRIRSFVYHTSRYKRLIGCLNGVEKNKTIKTFRPIIERDMFFNMREVAKENADHKLVSADPESEVTRAFCSLISNNHHLEELCINANGYMEGGVSSNTDFFNEANTRKIFNALSTNLSISTIGYVKNPHYENILVEHLRENIHVTSVNFHAGEMRESEDNFGAIYPVMEGVTAENKNSVEAITSLLQRNKKLIPLVSCLKEALTGGVANSNSSSDMIDLTPRTSTSLKPYANECIEKAFREAERLYNAGMKDAYYVLANFCERWLNKDISLAIAAYQKVSQNDREFYTKAQAQLAHLKLCGDLAASVSSSSSLMGLDEDVDMTSGNSQSSSTLSNNSQNQLLEAVKHSFNARVGRDIMDRKPDADKKGAGERTEGDKKGGNDRVAMDCTDDSSSDDLCSLAVEKFLNNGAIDNPNPLTHKITPNPDSVIFLLQEIKRREQKKAEELKILQDQNTAEKKKLQDQLAFALADKKKLQEGIGQQGGNGQQQGGIAQQGGILPIAQQQESIMQQAAVSHSSNQATQSRLTGLVGQTRKRDEASMTINTTERGATPSAAKKQKRSHSSAR